MIGTRKDINRWVVVPLFIAMVSATSVAAKLSFVHLDSADAAENLFHTVIDHGADAQPINGTVTETASQARVLERTGQPLEGGTPPVSAAPVVTTAAVIERPVLSPDVRSPQVVRPLPRPASKVTQRPTLASIGSQELRRLREENQALKKLLTDLSDRADTATDRSSGAPKPRRSATMAAVVSLIRM